MNLDFQSAVFDVELSIRNSFHYCFVKILFRSLILLQNERMVFQYQWDDKEREEVADMCKAWEDQFNDGVAEGVSRGRNQEKQDVIRNMLRMGMSDEIIRAVTECGQSMIDKLKIEAGIATLDAAR